jgi:glycosyltransferase involved in cell wall biosynthesis
MRILFISNYYPPFEVGGYEQLCRDVANRLAARGHQVAVLTSDRRVAGREAADDDHIKRTLRIGPSPERPGATGIEFFVSRQAKTRHNLRRLDQALDEFRPDVAFIWNLQGLPIELAKACERRQELAVAYWLAGYSPAEPDGYWRYWQRTPGRTILRIVKSTLAPLALRIMAAEGKPIRPQMKYAAVVSHYMRDQGIAAGTLPPNVQVIYNGVEFETFYHPVRIGGDGRVLRLLQAGRVSRDKGVHTSIQALGRPASQGQAERLQLLIAGSGPAEYEQELQRLAADQALEKQVKFLGWMPREKMPEIMANAEILLLPTEHPEPFARVMLEGMAAGLTVIGSRTGGTEELLWHGQNGLTFEAGDSRDLARQLERLLDDDELRRRLASAGQKQVKEAYTLEIMVTRLEQLLEQSLAGA